MKKKIGRPTHKPTTKKDRTVKQRQTSYRARMAEKGLECQLVVFLPTPEARDLVREYAYTFIKAAGIEPPQRQPRKPSKEKR